MKVGELVDKYIQLRDKKAEIAARHKDELAPYNEALKKLEGIFAEHMLKHGEDAIHTEAGTAYTQVRSSAKVLQWDAFLDFVIQNEAWHMLEQRAAKSAVEEAMLEGVEVPGIELKRENVVNVRRK